MADYFATRGNEGGPGYPHRVVVDSVVLYYEY